MTTSGRTLAPSLLTWILIAPFLHLGAAGATPTISATSSYDFASTQRAASLAAPSTSVSQIDYGSSLLGLGGSGAATLGLGGSGDATLGLGGSGAATAGLGGSGANTRGLGGSGDATKGLGGSGAESKNPAWVGKVLTMGWTSI